MSTGTVSRWVRLTEMGVIKRFTAIINPELMGKVQVMDIHELLVRTLPKKPRE